MKKILTVIILLMLCVNVSNAQVKVTFTLANKTISSGILSYDVIATVPVGTTWKVGACNIRVNVGCNPSGSLGVHADNPAVDANSNISGVNGYSAMTTTPVDNGKAIGLNVFTLNTGGFYQFAGGSSYNLGKIRFDILTPTTFYADTMKFRNSPQQYSSVVYDSTVELTYPTTYNSTDPVITGITGLTETLPTEFQIYQNYPNPFNPTTTIKYDVPKSSFVNIKVYDVTGKVVTELVNKDMNAGRYEVNWNASVYASGIYFYKIETKDFTKVMKMVLLK
jgi:hypothetical protein